jgi:hypothetical protein
LRQGLGGIAMPRKTREQAKTTLARGKRSRETEADAEAKDLRQEYEAQFDCVVADAVGFWDTFSSSPAATPKDELNRRIKRWQDGTKSLTHTFVQELCYIQPDYEWVCWEAAEAWPFFDAKCFWWIAMICKLASHTAHPLETSNDVARRHERIRATNLAMIERARRLTLADARRRLEGQVTRQAFTKKRDPFAKRIGELMQKYPLWSNERIIGKYVDEGGEVSARWKKHDHREDGDMLDVYRCKKCRHPLESHIVRIRRKSGLPHRR